MVIRRWIAAILLTDNRARSKRLLSARTRPNRESGAYTKFGI